MYLVDELIINRIRVPADLSVESLTAALQGQMSPDQLERMRN